MDNIVLHEETYADSVFLSFSKLEISILGKISPNSFAIYLVLTSK